MDGKSRRKNLWFYMNIQIYTCPYLNKSLQVFKIFELLNLSSFDDVQILKFYFKFQKKWCTAKMRSLYFSWLQHRVLEREKLKLNLIYFSIVRIQNLVPDWFEVSDSEVFHCFVIIITVKTMWWTVLLFKSYCKSWPASRVHQATPNSWPGSSRNVELIGNHYCLKLEFGLFMNLVLLSVQAVTLYTLAFDFKLNWTGLQMEPSIL